MSQTGRPLSLCCLFHCALLSQHTVVFSLKSRTAREPRRQIRSESVIMWEQAGLEVVDLGIVDWVILMLFGS